MQKNAVLYRYELVGITKEIFTLPLVFANFLYDVLHFLIFGKNHVVNLNQKRLY